MDKHTNDAIYVTQKSDVAELVLNRPEKRNALSEEMWSSLPTLLDQVRNSCRILLVRGEGKHFASGADISEFEALYQTPERGQANSLRISEALDALARFPRPTLAVVRGACVGGGCGIALACDFRFADETARFAITPAKMGLLYPFNDTKRLVDTVGSSMAKDILLSARQLDADEALKSGLANRMTSVDNLNDLVATYVERLLDMSPRSVEHTKTMIGLVLGGQDQDTDETQKLYCDAFNSSDFKEGFRAFLDKRKPDFS